MSTFLLAVVTAALLCAAPLTAGAAPLKTYVADFSVAGSPDQEQLKSTLPGLLASRLNPGQAQLVEDAAGADLTLAGSYALFGKLFSLDVLVKPATGPISKVFEQGEGPDDLLPAMGRLAAKLERELTRISVAVPAAAPRPSALSPQTLPAAAPAAEREGVKNAASAAAAESYIVKSASAAATATSAPLDGVFNSIALGRTLPTGERELFVAGERSLRYLQSGRGLKQIAEVVIPIPARILAVDAADLDHDGIPEIYLTIIDREALSSRIYRPAGQGLELLADHQPWFFRGSGTDLKNRAILVQGMDSSGDYYGGVAELVKTGNRFEARSPRSLPRHGSIFNTASFRDAAGSELTALLDEDGYLLVTSHDGSQLWKSSDKYGGSETNFKHQALARMRSTGDQFRWTFIEQRMFALPDGTLLLPHNEGTFTIGNNRSYNKHSLYALKWNGALFRELWHTRQTPSYLADYAYDPATHELILLEVVQRAGLFSGGKTAISINRID